MEGSVSSSLLPYLPEDLIIEVLLRLPVKSLVRFCCVCKFFQYLITFNRFFIRSHLQISLNNNNSNPGRRQNVLLPDPFRHHLRSTDCIENLDLQCKRILRELAYLLSNSRSCRLIFERDTYIHHQFVGCCDGIICLSYACGNCYSWDPNLVIYLCNPALNQWRLLPRNNDQTNRWMRDHISDTKVSFIFDRASNDYKVIIVTVQDMFFMVRDMTFKVEIYSLCNDSWRAFTWGMPGPSKGKARMSNPEFHNGFLYWITKRSDGHTGHNILNVLDMSEEKIRTISLPDCFCNMGSLYLLRYEGSLAISEYVNCLSNELWVMKEDDVGVSWVKKLLDLNPVCSCPRFSYSCQCSYGRHLCILPWATTNWTYFEVYGGKIYWGGVDNGRRAEEFILVDRLSFRSCYIAAEYVASLVSVIPSPQAIHGTFMQRLILDGREKKDNILNVAGREKEDKILDDDGEGNQTAPREVSCSFWWFSLRKKGKTPEAKS